MFNLERKGEMENKKIFIVAFLAVFLVSVVCAAQTEVVVQADPNQNLLVRVLNSVDGSVVNSFYLETDDSGRASSNFFTDLDTVNFKVMLIENGKTIKQTNFGGIYATGGEILLKFSDYVPENSESLEDKAEEESSEEESSGESESEDKAEEESSEEGEPGITGLSVYKDFFSKNKYYVFGIVVVLVIGGLAMLLFKFKPKVSKEYTQYKKTSGDASKIKVDEEKELADAEEKLKKAQEEINELKNKDKISAAERKLAADRAELDRLRRG